MNELILYGTLGCHLCELAQDILNRKQIVYKYTDIADSQSLMDNYALRIPVLFNPQSGADLGWPLDESSLDEWLTRQSL